MRRLLQMCLIACITFSLALAASFHPYAYAVSIGNNQFAGGPGTVTLNPSSGSAGTKVSLTGSLLPGDTGCTITSPSMGFVLGYRCTVLPGGLVNGSFTVGTVMPGQYLILVSGTPGNPNGDYAQALFAVT
ncbi:MAG TPA: hypothetical protein VE862_02445 [Candidatus Acidoferrum sp.]|nr:hypothetical protein [Candidatus Acidoferrum sp.]